MPRDLGHKRRYQRLRRKLTRAEWLVEHGPCVKCGSKKELQVDHIDPEDKVTHRVWSWSKARREVELAKCQVLCHECHKKKTAKQNGYKTK